MALVRIRETGEIQTDNQFVNWLKTEGNTSIPDDRLTPEILDTHGADPVVEGAQPTGEPWQHAVPDGVVQDGQGRWTTTYRLEPETLSSDGLDTQRDLKLAALAAKRWEVETGGVTIGGIPVKTDADTQRKITGAYVQATRDPDFVVRWKLGPATYTTLDAATIIVIGDAVTAHIQACFVCESDLADQIVGAADWDELAAVDIQSGWPA